MSQDKPQQQKQQKQQSKHPIVKCNLAGRPRTYDDAFIEKEAELFLKWIDENEHAIFLKEFAFERGYSPTKLQIFADRNEQFRIALAIAHEWQEMKLSKGGLTRDYAEGFTKFVLARNHGWNDTKNINITSNNPLPGWVVDAAGKSTGLINDNKSSS